MKKVLSELTVSLCILGSFWLLLSKIEWTSMFGIDKDNDNLEEQIGKLYGQYLEQEQDKLASPDISIVVDSLRTHIFIAKDISRESIKLHVVNRDIENAYVAPGRYMVVFTGMLKKCANESELAGVLGHELAHIEKKHAMKKLIRQTGLAVLVGMVSGNGGIETGAELGRVLSSASYSREMESEADLTAVDYLIKAEINPEPFAELMFQFGSINDKLPGPLKYLSTHPGSEDRAIEIIHYIKKGHSFKPVLQDATWQKMKEAVKE
ncbi:MAG: M48 family metallopeptidase [Cytophagaceae bacterium]